MLPVDEAAGHAGQVPDPLLVSTPAGSWVIKFWREVHAGGVKLGVHCLLLVLKPGKITQRVIRDWKEVQALGPGAPQH